MTQISLLNCVGPSHAGSERFFYRSNVAEQVKVAEVNPKIETAKNGNDLDEIDKIVHNWQTTYGVVIFKSIDEAVAHFVDAEVVNSRSSGLCPDCIIWAAKNW